MTKKQFTRRIDKDIIAAIKKYGKDERKSDTEVIENALREYLRSKGYWPPKNV